MIFSCWLSTLSCNCRFWIMASSNSSWLGVFVQFAFQGIVGTVQLIQVVRKLPVQFQAVLPPVSSALPCFIPIIFTIWLISGVIPVLLSGSLITTGGSAGFYSQQRSANRSSDHQHRRGAHCPFIQRTDYGAFFRTGYKVRLDATHKHS